MTNTRNSSKKITKISLGFQNCPANQKAWNYSRQIFLKSRQSLKITLGPLIYCQWGVKKDRDLYYQRDFIEKKCFAKEKKPEKSAEITSGE